jgi:V/A-type H+-transporting ATPase subunit B
LAAVIGEEGLSAVDQAYLEFGKVFEEEFINQGKRERRAIDETLDLGWEALSILPRRELTRVRDEDLAIRYRGGRARAGRPEEET